MNTPSWTRRCWRKIGDPLVHLVRNAIDHGLEMPDKRRAAGKVEQGTLRLEAFHRGGSIVVEVGDDGAGLNRDAIVAKAVQRGLISSGEGMSDEAVAELIFQPGFSTAAVTTDLSGRGVGMDVVRRNVADLGGTVTIRSTPRQGQHVHHRAAADPGHHRRPQRRGRRGELHRAAGFHRRNRAAEAGRRARGGRRRRAVPLPWRVPAGDPPARGVRLPRCRASRSRTA